MHTEANTNVRHQVSAADLLLVVKVHLYSPALYSRTNSIHHKIAHVYKKQIHTDDDNNNDCNIHVDSFEDMTSWTASQTKTISEPHVSTLSLF